MKSKIIPTPKKEPEKEIITESPVEINIATTSGPDEPMMVGTAPCDWSIRPQGGGTIMAKHNTTQKTFIGTIEEFNAALRG